MWVLNCSQNISSPLANPSPSVNVAYYSMGGDCHYHCQFPPCWLHPASLTFCRLCFRISWENMGGDQQQQWQPPTWLLKLFPAHSLETAAPYNFQRLSSKGTYPPFEEIHSQDHVIIHFSCQDFSINKRPKYQVALYRTWAILQFCLMKRVGSDKHTLEYKAIISLVYVFEKFWFCLCICFIWLNCYSCSFCIHLGNFGMIS